MRSKNNQTVMSTDGCLWFGTFAIFQPVTLLFSSERLTTCPLNPIASHLHCAVSLAVIPHTISNTILFHTVLSWFVSNLFHWIFHMSFTGYSSFSLSYSGFPNDQCWACSCFFLHSPNWANMFCFQHHPSADDTQPYIYSKEISLGLIKKKHL